MAVIATDDFNRANGAIGANWSDVDSTFLVSSNTAIPNSYASDAVVRYSAATWPNDQYCLAAIRASGGGIGTGIGLVLRCSTSVQTYYRFVVDVTGVDIGRVVTGAFTPITTRATTWGIVTASDILKCEIQGTTIRVYKNGVQLGADITDANIASGQPGLGYSSTGSDSFLDNWEGGDFSTPATGASVAWIRA